MIHSHIIGLSVTPVSTRLSSHLCMKMAFQLCSGYFERRNAAAGAASGEPWLSHRDLKQWCQVREQRGVMCD